MKIPPMKAQPTATKPNLPPMKYVDNKDTINEMIGISQKINENPELGESVFTMSENALIISVSGLIPTCIHKPLRRPNPKTNSCTKDSAILDVIVKST